MKQGLTAKQFLGWLIVGILFIAICPIFSPTPDSPSTAALAPTRTEISNVTPTRTARPTSTRTHQAISLHACVKDSSINVRKGPGTQYPAIDGLASHTCVAIVGRNEDATWVYMTTGEKSGWIAAWLLTIDGSVYAAPVRVVSNPLPVSTVAPPQTTQHKKTPDAQNSANQSEGNNSASNSSGANITVTGGDSSGPSALCNDGTYSYSSRRRGTCSHHGGVAEWLKDLPP